MSDTSADTTTVDTSEIPTPPALREIHANYNKFVDIVDTKFGFKKRIHKETGAEIDRPAIECKIPVPSVEGIINILTKEGNEKELALLREAVAEVIMTRARTIISDDESFTTETMERFPYSQLTWEAIANLPKAERRGGGISKEVWEEFKQDYIEVMPAVTGKEVDKVANAAEIFVSKFTKIKSEKKVIKVLKDYLALYASNSPNAEKFIECIDFLNTKATTLIEADDSKLLDNL